MSYMFQTTACVALECDTCSCNFSHDGDSVSHFETREEAMTVARDGGWTVRDEGACCHYCQSKEKTEKPYDELHSMDRDATAIREDERARREVRALAEQEGISYAEALRRHREERIRQEALEHTPGSNQ